MKQLKIEFPSKLLPLYKTKKRFIVIYGGRGSGKSWGVADFLLIKAYEKKTRILCTREVQTSIKDSVHKLLSDRINQKGLQNFFRVTEKNITGINGSEFIFKGLHRNSQDIKSTEGIDYCWVEEGQSTTEKSLQDLIPTIRKEGSQIIFVYNPESPDAPVHKNFTLAERDDVEKIKINYTDNPFFPRVLRSDMEYDKRVNFEKYLHVWEGECRIESDALIFKGKFFSSDFVADSDTQFYFGVDWGFSVDPIAVIRFFIKDNSIYIDYEAGGVGVQITDTPALFDQIPLIRENVITADNARPEMISFMKSQGFNIRAAEKGQNSVREGVEFLRSFEKIIIHPRCKRTLDEFKFYSYKVDKLTGDVQTTIEDKNNHFIDALRYGSEKIRKFNTYARVLK